MPESMNFEYHSCPMVKRNAASEILIITSKTVSAEETVLQVLSSSKAISRPLPILSFSCFKGKNEVTVFNCFPSRSRCLFKPLFFNPYEQVGKGVNRMPAKITVSPEIMATT